jgi:lipid A disaccharide synthetase
VRRHAAELLQAAAAVAHRLPEARFVVRLAHEAHRPWFEEAARGARARPERLDVRVGAAPAEAPLLGAIACSGTVTAELAVDLVPQAVFYRMNLPTRVIAWTIVTAPWFTLPNLVLGEGLVREEGFFRRGAGDRLAADFLAVAGTAEAWTAHRERLGEVRRRLERPDVADRIARAALGVGPRR